MNEEKLKFIPGDTTVCESGGDVYTQIHVVGERLWLGRIEVYGKDIADAEGLRDRVLWALNQPTVPTQFQAFVPVGDGMGVADGSWINLDDGGEAARLKGEGYEIRALYAKQPIK